MPTPVAEPVASPPADVAAPVAPVAEPVAPPSRESRAVRMGDLHDVERATGDRLARLESRIDALITRDELDAGDGQEGAELAPAAPSPASPSPSLLIWISLAGMLGAAALFAARRVIP